VGAVQLGVDSCRRGSGGCSDGTAAGVGRGQQRGLLGRCAEEGEGDGDWRRGSVVPTAGGWGVFCGFKVGQNHISEIALVIVCIKKNVVQINILPHDKKFQKICNTRLATYKNFPLF